MVCGDTFTSHLVAFACSTNGRSKGTRWGLCAKEKDPLLITRLTLLLVPFYLLRMCSYSQAWFCLEPPGDTHGRRSLFDCLMHDTIPVVRQGVVARDGCSWLYGAFTSFFRALPLAEKLKPSAFQPSVKDLSWTWLAEQSFKALPSAFPAAPQTGL